MQNIQWVPGIRARYGGKATPKHIKAAQAIRKILKDNFPGEKIYVKSENSTGTPSIAIFMGGESKIINGQIDPECPQNLLRDKAEKLVGHFQYEGYDGMQDRRDDIPQVKYIVVMELAYKAYYGI
ncbi:MAG: hypothetical protein JKP92_06015 [Alphaproteobacteria bacterium]|jgi:hypothetical protein|nr:hypothetical protein [Alphaproteobacteria bacterium]